MSYYAEIMTAGLVCSQEQNLMPVKVCSHHPLAAMRSPCLTYDLQSLLALERLP